MLKFIADEGCSLGLRFVFVYIREAHASDKWPMKWAVEWPEPQSLEARIACAQKCDQDLGWSPTVEVMVDGMGDDFCHGLGAWPAGGYVIGPDRRLLYVCAPSQSDVFFEEEQLFGYLRSRHWSVAA